VDVHARILCRESAQEQTVAARFYDSKMARREREILERSVHAVAEQAAKTVTA
jgi:hypothetical protein